MNGGVSETLKLEVVVVPSIATKSIHNECDPLYTLLFLNQSSLFLLREKPMWSSGTLARWHQRKKQLKQAVRNIGLSQRSRAKLEGFTACELPISVNNSEPAKKDSSKEVHFRIDDLTSSDGPPNLARCWISKSLSLFSSFLITSSPPSSPFHLLLTLLQDECFNGSFIFTIQPIFYLQLCLLYFFLFISLLSNFLPR